MDAMPGIERSCGTKASWLFMLTVTLAPARAVIVRFV
jgi:hypothetical protein